MELISREALLKQIEIDSDGNRGQYGDEWFFIDTIKKMPSQWVEINEPPFGKVYQNDFVTFLSTETYDEVRSRLRRPKGKWIETNLDCGKRHIRCNQCWYTDCEIPKEKIKDMDYCPQCGADMRGEQDEMEI